MALFVRAKCRKCGTDQDVRVPGEDYIFRAKCRNCQQDIDIEITKIEAVVRKPRNNGGAQ